MPPGCTLVIVFPENLKLPNLAPPVPLPSIVKSVPDAAVIVLSLNVKSPMSSVGRFNVVVYKSATWISFHLVVALPNVYVLSVSGIRSLAIAALNSIVSVSASPITMLPPIVISPPVLMLPVTYKSPVIFVLPITSNVPAPLGRSSKLVLETVVEIVLPVSCKSSTCNLEL